MMRNGSWPLVATALAALMPRAAHGQSIEELRRQISDDLRKNGTLGTYGSLVTSSGELELSGATYTFEDAEDTQVTIFAVPFSRVFHPFGETSGVGLHVEGALGYLREESSTSDVYGGTAPSLVTSLDSTFTTFGAIGGAGPRLEIGRGLSLTPILNFGVSHLESEATYGGPGAAFSQAIFDGVAFNWDAIALVAGGAARLEYEHMFASKVELSAVARYDYRLTDTVDYDDQAQNFTAVTQFLTLRTNFKGPTNVGLAGGSIYWTANAGYRKFLDGDMADVTDFFHLGGGAELRDVWRIKPSLQATLIVGPDVVGYSVGLGFAF